MVLHATAAEQNQETQEFFDSTNLVTFRVELSDGAVGDLADRPREYVCGKVNVGERVWENVGIRLKGSGTFQPIYDHPSLALKFNWKEPHQRFAGLTKLFLENSGQDATRMCKLIANGAYADCGLAAPRITQARVQLNGRDLGRYVVAEAINKGFLRDHFGDAEGNLYEADFRDVDRSLKQANGERGNQSDLRQLSLAAKLSEPKQRAEALARVLDTEEFLNFLAIEMILANWDGYAFQQNNYRVYHTTGRGGRLTFIPHDLDNTFFESDMCLMPPRNGLLTQAFLDSADARKDFRQRVAKLVPTVLDSEKIRRRVQASAMRMSQGATPDEQAVIHRQAALVERRVAERLEHLKDELAGTRPPAPVFDSAGVAHLGGWSAKPDWNNSEPKTVTQEGETSLSIEAGGGYCFGSWRLPVWLAPGRYRIEGTARASGVAGLPSQTGSGVGVRVLGSRRGSGLQGDCSRWTPVRHDFTVQDDCEWVELIAELRAYAGQGWFDPESLRLVKLR